MANERSDRSNEPDARSNEPNAQPIDRSDLENKLREIEEIVDESKQQAQVTGTAIAVAVVVIVVVIFFLGRRRGKRLGGARVEVYRLQ